MLTRQHKMLTKELVLQMPALYAQDGLGDSAIVYAHYFSPYSNWDWYALEFDGKDIFFGYVCGLERELGYFSLAELSDAVLNVSDVSVFAVERDVHWQPTPLSEVRRMP